MDNAFNVIFLFTACAFKDPLGSKFEGKVSSIEHKSIVGCKLIKFEQFTK